MSALQDGCLSTGKIEMTTISIVNYFLLYLNFNLRLAPPKCAVYCKTVHKNYSRSLELHTSLSLWWWSGSYQLYPCAHAQQGGGGGRKGKIKHSVPLYFQAILLLIFTIIFLVFSLFIYVEFGWKTYVLVDCNPAMRCK